MRRLSLLLLACALAACGQRATPPIVTITPRPPTEVVPTATLSPATPTAVVEATPAPTQPAAPPTPTSIAEGMQVRLGTPDPNPNCPAHYSWFFDNHADECADFVRNNWTVWQPFEHGLMVWSQERGEVWVLIDDGSPFRPYQQVTDTLGLPLPGPDPNIVPPEGLYQPELGFANFWRGLVPGHEWVRQRLGWATAPETAYSAFWQCNTAQANGQRCYFNGPRDELIAMTTGSAPYWTYLQRAVR